MRYSTSCKAQIFYYSVLSTLKISELEGDEEEMVAGTYIYTTLSISMAICMPSIYLWVACLFVIQRKTVICFEKGM